MVAKTTIELPDALLAEAKEVAARERTTLRALVEAGLRAVVERKQRPDGPGFRLRDVRFGGDGLQPEFQDAHWERLRDAAYEGRGS